MKIYTKAGDAGETRLFGGGPVPKDDPRVRAYGDVDELNATLGFGIALAPEDSPARRVARASDRASSTTTAAGSSQEIWVPKSELNIRPSPFEPPKPPPPPAPPPPGPPPAAKSARRINSSVDARPPG